MFAGVGVPDNMTSVVVVVSAGVGMPGNMTSMVVVVSAGVVCQAL